MEKDRKAEVNLDAERLNINNPLPRSASPLNTKHQQLINQHLPLGIVESTLEGQYLDVNEAFCRMLGYDRDELLQAAKAPKIKLHPASGENRCG